MGVGHSAKTARILAANVLQRNNVITSMGAVSVAVTGAIRESSAPKVAHLQTKSSAPKVAHLQTKSSAPKVVHCLLYTSDAADDMQCVDLGGRRIIKKA